MTANIVVCPGNYRNDLKSSYNCEIWDLKTQFLVFAKNLAVNKIYTGF